jgi:hypothetical protein
VYNLLELLLKASLSPGRSNEGWFFGDGFIAFLLLQQMGWGQHGPQIEGRPALLLFAGSRPVLGSLPSVALSSAGAKRVFPVSVPLEVYRAGNGKRQFELVASGVPHDFAIVG